MPVTPLPDNNTHRMYVDYTSRAVPHTMMFRWNDTAAPDAAAFAVLGFLEALRPSMMNTDSFYGMRWSAKNSNISYPLGFTSIVGQSSNGSNEVDPESFFFGFNSRDRGEGRRYNLTFYGTRNNVARPPTNRWGPGQNVVIQPALNQLKSLADFDNEGPHIVSIAAVQLYFQEYVNCANNAYWQREQRG